MKVSLTIPAVPVAQPRPRAVSFAGKARMANAPKSHPVHDFKASVRMAWQSSGFNRVFDEPLDVSIRFVMPRPSNKRWKSKPMPREPYAAKKNDWDNLGKAVCDALNGVAWTDDGLIMKATVERWIAAGDEQPHVELTVQTFDHAPEGV